MSLVITGHFCVDKMQRADAGQPVLDETTDESLLRRACDGVHRYGGKLFFRLSHSGIDFNRRAGQKTPFYLDALICEPDFAAKLKSGAQDGSKCLTCNGCYTIYRKRFVRCVQHQDEIEQFKTIPW